ncbi:MAG: MFS transporter [Pseudobdellovibrionaceae bacterium]|jgi:FHS family glucose/mannose:H+ symporter-like MFS transporter
MLHFRALCLAYVSLFILGLGDNVRGPLFPEILKSFGISSSTGSLFFVVASMMGTVSGFVAAPAFDRVGTLNTLRLGLLAFGLGLLGFAIAPSFEFLLLGSFLFGIGLGFMGVVQNFYVIAAAPPERTQQLQSGLHSMYGMASFAAPAMVGVVSALHWDWKISYWVVVVLCFLVLAGTYWPGKELPKPQKLLDGQSKTSRRELLFWNSALACYVLFEIMVGTRMAQFMREAHGMNLEMSSFWTTAFFAFLLSGRVLFVFWKPKARIRTQLFLSLGGATLLMTVGLLIHPVALVLSGLAMSPFYPLAMTAAGRLFKDELHIATSYAITVVGVFVVLMHFLVGALTDQFGIQGALLIGPVFGVIAILLLFSYPRIFKKDLNF